jgi:alkanesulfonate monooxygenase SsuD/methylene tetrahydromethanopterin reductase-like flavin-dependent oxidoreductase (luciferase family)
VLEHHFSDWYPTPDPLMVLGHLAPQFPTLELGTDVIVTPWHDPLRLAEQIGLLTVMTKKDIHLGLGRGSAKLEYGAFGVPMEESRVRFKEIWEILNLALSGNYFSYQGEKYNIENEIRVRPRPAADRINFYGAVGSAATASLMAEWGLPPLCTSSIGDAQMMYDLLSTWRESAERSGHATDRSFPIQIITIMEDTDEAAVEMAKKYIPQYNQKFIKHYEVGKTEYGKIRSFEGWQKTYQGLFKFTDPNNIPEWSQYQFVGSPETVRKQLQSFIDAGFDHFIINTILPGIPRKVHQRWSELFAKEVVPYVNTAG